MSLPVSVGEILELIRLAKKGYDAIKDTNDKIKQAVQQVLDQQYLVQDIQRILDADTQLQRSSQDGQRTLLMREKVDQVHRSMQLVNKLIDEYKSHRGSSGSVSVFYKSRFNMSGKMTKLETACALVATNVGALHAWLSNLTTSYTQEIHSVAHRLGTGMQDVQSSMQDILRAVNGSRQVDAALIDSQSASIIFIDKDNTGRSKVAEAYAMLVNHWTSANPDRWPVKRVSSAGLNVRWHNECTDYYDKVEMKLKDDGQERPSSAAIDALFDDGEFAHEAFNSTLKEAVLKTRSRGLPSAIFQDYKYVITFTRSLKKALVQLKEEIGKSNPEHEPRDMGQIISLGSFGQQTKTDILHPTTKGKDPAADLANWRARISLIQAAYKNLLEQEMGWRPPVAQPMSTTL
ncbi:hypothetical protein BDZ85DRAFT_257482 [Elsinoe ampelina]|uniref:Uncharacterized protein n=1 Tax=Elsinoe ampelina TaxID=302913 RepID=A0A6A6GI67_9PEZI|nr:hypothetical protein BDZ85DRAFT_257482 [Elsinoe ampelina]